MAAVLEAVGVQSGAVRTSDRYAITARELDTLRLAVTGASRRMMGERLGISAHTVDSHLRHIYAKFGVSSRSAAAVIAMQRGLIKDHAIA